LLKSIPDSTFKVYIVWLPMLRADTREDAIEASSECGDARITYFWDKDKLTGEAFSQPLHTWTKAWDVYLLYERGARWASPAPAPEFWMHQLSSLVASGRALDPDTLEARCLSALRR
jgi:hypothetical protein